MVVDYDPERTAGMTDADMIDAISTIYGPRLKPATPNPTGRLANRRGVRHAHHSMGRPRLLGGALSIV
ncbi:MAG TPA: hypothetical protein VJV97_06800 [Gemmatimonadaceae bacterium]|nr:hypothetical protein [Gemmatimonadaceae bacterium]